MLGSFFFRLALAVGAFCTLVALGATRADALQTCTVTPPATYNFPNFDAFGARKLTTGTVKVACTGTGTTIPQVSLSAGTSGNENNRSMACISGACLSSYPGDVLLYNIYTDTARTIVWGAVGQAFASCSNTCTKSKIAYGLIPAAIAGSTNDIAVGGYSDTITITANY